MFKGILPSSKRISTSEFTIVTVPGGPQSGKENVPDATPALSKPGNQTPCKGNPKHEKSKTMSFSQDLADEPVVMHQAFDKLLVRLAAMICHDKYSTAHARRMSCKFLPLFE